MGCASVRRGFASLRFRFKLDKCQHWRFGGAPRREGHTAVMREVFPPPVGPTRRNVGREAAARDLNTNRWRNKGVRKITTTAATNTGNEGLKSEVKKE